MKFELRRQDGKLPEVDLGPPGQQLNFAFPDGFSCVQDNYGQGEGQFWCGDCAWGIYWDLPAGSLILILHQGRIGLPEALAFVEAVWQKIFKQTATTVFLSGDERDWVKPD